MIRFASVCAGVAGLLLALSAADGAARPLQLTDWLDWERAANPQISPDGERIVYTRSRIDKMQDRWASELWMMTVDGTRHRYLADGGDVRWSSSGDRIAFIDTPEDAKKAGIFVRWMDEDGATSQVARNLEGPSRLAWSPDGETLAVRARVPMTPDWTIELPARPEGAKWTDDPFITDRLHYRMDRVGRKGWFNHIFLVPAEGGTPHQLTEGEWDVGARAVGAIDAGGRLRFTPDGSEILFDGLRTENGAEPEPFVSHLYAVSVDDGAIRQITSEDGFWHSPVPSPDGSLVAYTGNAAAETNYKAQQLRVVGIDGSDPRVIVEALPAGASDITWSSDNSGIYYTVDFQGDRNIHFASTEGEHRPVTRGDHQLSLDSVSDGGTAVGILTAPDTTRNVARFDLESGGAFRQLTDLNADILADVELGPVEEFRVVSTDDADVQGWIIDPPDYDPAKSYPLLLAIHGGPHAMYGTEFRPMFQLFAARGYVVVYSNPRGSTGYGPDFANAIDNRYPGRRDFDDLMAATDAAVERRSIDTDRLFVQGCSGGGVLTSWVVGHTDRFAAAAARCPVINWLSFAGTADIVAWAHERFRPSLWEDTRRWLDHSPLMHAPDVTTPTLLMTGEKDLRTPLAQAEEFYSALKRLGVPTRLIAMKDEWHGTSSKPSNMLRTVLYMDKWFAEHDPGR